MSTLSAAPEHAAHPARPVRDAATALARTVAIVAAALVLGGLTSWGQTLLPDALLSLANSSGGWSILTAALVAALARRPLDAAVGGAAAFVALTVGYAAVSTWRGFDSTPGMWALIGVPAGIVVGLAAFGAARTTGRTATAGAAALAGILVGEAVYGLTVVSATTGPVWWAIQATAGLILAGAVAAREAARERDPGPVFQAVAGTAAVIAAFVTAYTLLPGAIGM